MTIANNPQAINAQSFPNKILNNLQSLSRSERCRVHRCSSSIENRLPAKNQKANSRSKIAAPSRLAHTGWPRTTSHNVLPSTSTGQSSSTTSTPCSANLPLLKRSVPQASLTLQTNLNRALLIDYKFHRRVFNAVSQSGNTAEFTN